MSLSLSISIDISIDLSLLLLSYAISISKMAFHLLICSHCLTIIYYSLFYDVFYVILYVICGIKSYLLDVYLLDLNFLTDLALNVIFIWLIVIFSLYLSLFYDFSSIIHYYYAHPLDYLSESLALFLMTSQSTIVY